MTDAPRLNCEQVIAFLADYLEHGLDAETLAKFEWHLERCASCRNYLASYRDTILLARAADRVPELHVEEPPEDLVAAILASVRPGE